MQPIKEDLAKHPKNTPSQKITISTSEEDCQWRLENYGYAPNPHCPICKGAGMVHPLKHGGVDYSRVIDCPAKGCINDSFAAYKRGESQMAVIGVSPKLQTFANFSKFDRVRETFKVFKDLASGESTYMMVLCYGVTGNGKTHLCNALARELTERGVSIKLYTVADMVSELRKGIDDNTIEDMVSKLKNVEALILDDFKEYGSVWELSRIEGIIDARYRNALITVLTTNQELRTIPDRIVSRFMDPALGKVVLNEGQDYRKRRR
jgi:DNA replication protein DnaC